MIEILAGLIGLGLIGAVAAFFRGKAVATKTANQKAEVVEQSHRAVVADAGRRAAETQVDAVKDRNDVEHQVRTDATGKSAADKLHESWSRD